MKKSILLLIVTVFTFSLVSAQTYTTTYTTKLVFKNGLNKLTIMPQALSSDITLTFPATNGDPYQVLQTDGSGGLSWVTVGSNSWGLTGNAGTTAGTNFVGTTDNIPLHLSVRNGVTIGNSLIFNTNGSIQRDNAGNARGTHALDLQMSRSTITEVASGMYSVIGGGKDNTASADHSVIGGGQGNSTGDFTSSTVSGGSNNTASANYSTVGGGFSNLASNQYSVVAGGEDNTASGFRSFVGSGNNNVASADHSAIVSGRDNQAADIYTFVGGGFANQASNDHSVTVGGNTNSAGGVTSFVGGGFSNNAVGSSSVVAGGNNNSALGDYAFTGGGSNVDANGNYSAISGGQTNIAAGSHASISGGNNNIATAQYSSVGGGAFNNAFALASRIGGGVSNYAGGDYSVIGGGLGNYAVGDYSAIPGGRGLTLTASADGSFGFLGGNSGGTNNMTIAAANTAVFANVDMWLGNNRNQASELRFYEAYNTNGTFPNTAKYVAFKSPSALTATQTYELPLDYPTVSGYVLSSTTGGAMSWVAAGGLSGGTSNAITKWTSATTIGNSSMTDNGTTVGIGANVSVDLASGNLNVVGEYQRGGSRILDNPGTNNLRVGKLAGHNNTGVSNTYVGASAGAGVSSGSDNVYLGFNAGVQSGPASSSNNVMIGSNVGTFSNGSNNNTFIGYGAAVLHTSGGGNTFLGTNAGAVSTTESNNTLIGGSTDMAASITRATAIGHRAYVGVSDALVLGAINGVNGSTSDALVGIGTASPTQKLEVKSGNVLLSNAGTPGQLQLQGTSTGTSTISAGAQGATTINYTLPTTQPMASQVLTATAVSGSGPYAVTLGWTMGGITYLKTADETLNNTGSVGATMQDDNHITGIPIGAGEIWAFDGFILYNSSSNAIDFKAQFLASGNMTLASYWTFGGPGFLTGIAESSVSAGTTSTSTGVINYNVANNISSIHVKGTVVNAGASVITLSLQWAQNSASNTNITVLAGSYLTFSRVK